MIQLINDARIQLSLSNSYLTGKAYSHCAIPMGPKQSSDYSNSIPETSLGYNESRQLAISGFGGTIHDHENHAHWHQRDPMRRACFKTTKVWTAGMEQSKGIGLLKYDHELIGGGEWQLLGFVHFYYAIFVHIWNFPLKEKMLGFYFLI